MKTGDGIVKKDKLPIIVQNTVNRVLSRIADIYHELKHPFLQINSRVMYNTLKDDKFS
jgi:hypothetical protein